MAEPVAPTTPVKVDVVVTVAGKPRQSIPLRAFFEALRAAYDEADGDPAEAEQVILRALHKIPRKHGS